MAERKRLEIIKERGRCRTEHEKYIFRVGNKQIRDLTDDEYLAFIRSHYSHL